MIYRIDFFQPDKPKVTNTLQRAGTTITSLSTCRAYNSDVDESNICTYKNGVGLCKFDTGKSCFSINF